MEQKKGQQVLTTKPSRVYDKIHRTVADNCPLHRSIHRLPFFRSKFPISRTGTDNTGGKVTTTTTTITTTSDSLSNSKTHFYLGKLITPHKTHPAEQVNIPIEPGSSVVKNTGRFQEKTVIPVQIQATKPQMPVSGFQSKPVLKNTASSNKNETANGGGGGNHHDHNHKYTAYIEHVKNQMRSKSDIGQEIITEGPIATRTATKRDSFNDRITNFITRANKNIKMTHPGE